MHHAPPYINRCARFVLQVFCVLTIPINLHQMQTRNTEKSNRATYAIPKMKLFRLEFFDVQKIT